MNEVNPGGGMACTTVQKRPKICGKSEISARVPPPSLPAAMTPPPREGVFREAKRLPYGRKLTFHIVGDGFPVPLGSPVGELAFARYEQMTEGLMEQKIVRFFDFSANPSVKNRLRNADF